MAAILMLDVSRIEARTAMTAACASTRAFGVAPGTA